MPEKPTVEGIRGVKERYVTNIYGDVRGQQEIDNTYIEDTFKVPEIKEPHKIYRSGIGDRVVNAPAEHIITSNPHVFFYPRRANKTAEASALKLSKVVNEQWLPLLQKQNPNIFKEFIKNLLGRGEAYFQVGHSTNGDLPVKFLVPDSMVIYGSPEESMDGIPEKVIVYYNISQYEDLIPKYPWLAEYKNKIGEEGRVQWFEYYDKGYRYIEAAEIALTKNGVQPNVYGFTPFVRKFSGFGRRSPDGSLTSLIVSDIRRSRDLIREECATRSNIASIEYLFAHKPKTFIGRGLTADGLRESVSFGEYDINAIDADPNQIRIDEIDITPNVETYKHHADIMSELNQRHPFIMAGFPLGNSGRQQDITELSAMRRYDSAVENCQYAFATALQMAFKICLATLNIPPGLSEQDLKTEMDIEVKLKAKDPIEEDRKVTMGNRLWNGGKGSISLSTFHTQYLGLTQSESNKETAKMLADQVTIYNPDIASVLGMVAAEESGMEEWLMKAQERMNQMGGGIREPLPRTGVERVQGEVQTTFGAEESVSRGARQPPSGYYRG